MDPYKVYNAYPTTVLDLSLYRLIQKSKSSCCE
uniref:Uncharacterized protein n=1 Tax=Rhizophora mucronata TaxID=61149 RepID=A0A2P2NBS0_RHIMU